VPTISSIENQSSPEEYSEREIVTLRMEEDLLEDLDSAYGPGEEYDNRTEVVIESLKNLIEGNFQPETEDHKLYTAAVNSYFKAGAEKNYQIQENAAEHILEEFSDSPAAEFLS